MQQRRESARRKVMAKYRVCMIEDVSKSYVQDVEADNEQEAIREAQESRNWNPCNEWENSMPSYTAKKA
jgi:hypothetical protein